MAKQQVNMFAQAQAKREAEQAQIKAKCGLNKPVNTTKKKVRLDVTVPADTKSKLVAYAEKKDLSASVCIQMLIDEACGE